MLSLLLSCVKLPFVGTLTYPKDKSSSSEYEETTTTEYDQKGIKNKEVVQRKKSKASKSTIPASQKEPLSERLWNWLWDWIWLFVLIVGIMFAVLGVPLTTKLLNRGRNMAQEAVMSLDEVFDKIITEDNGVDEVVIKDYLHKYLDKGQRDFIKNLRSKKS